MAFWLPVQPINQGEAVVVVESDGQSKYSVPSSGLCLCTHRINMSIYAHTQTYKQMHLLKKNCELILHDCKQKLEI